MFCTGPSALFCLFFFFSSRRRHTRCLSDWSSDVCSSDLRLGQPRLQRDRLLRRRLRLWRWLRLFLFLRLFLRLFLFLFRLHHPVPPLLGLFLLLLPLLGQSLLALLAPPQPGLLRGLPGARLLLLFLLGAAQPP